MDITQQVLDNILPKVAKPARYTGHEWNSVVKDWARVEVKVALAYPDVYEVGMSNLGLMILYDILNREEGVLAERVYAPWIDMEQAMRRAGISLYSLESRRPLGEFDIIGFSLQYELNYTNVLNMLHLAGLSPLAAERGDADPLIIGGGSCAYNAEPLADFFDLFVIGEGEEVLLELVKAYRECRGTKADFLREAAKIEGVYVPSLYDVRYHHDGTVAAVEPLVPEARARIRKRVVETLPPAPTRLVVPYIGVIHDRAMIEIQRGCTQGCRFCQAGFIYRPRRERPLDEVLEAVEDIVKETGYEEVALVSLSSSDHSQIEPLVRQLTTRYQHPPLSISLPSLRIDSFSVELAEMFQGRRKTGLTFAPEAGSQRLRDVINKNVTEEDLLRTAEAAYSSSWRRIKLYFMVGLPTETLEDVAAIVDLVKKVRAVGRRHQGKRTQVNVSLGTFVPKAFTPFQWLPLVDEANLEEKQKLLRRGLRGPGIGFSWHDPRTTLLEAAFSRGDRRLGQVVHRAWQLGARFDAWDELLNEGLWWRAFAEAGLDPNFYARRERRLDEVLPWDHIDVGVRKEFLIEQYQCSLRGETAIDCREGCIDCGVSDVFWCYYPALLQRDRQIPLASRRIWRSGESK
ncbi:MAG: TIGR03960 family B12-binding radical SAM protein [Anaerolineae bacterium]|nr:TIGR03960 family B12-binding radical SAM protein [Anaerolineae bacterium]